MFSVLRPAFRPLPLLGASSLILAATLTASSSSFSSTSSRRQVDTTKPPTQAAATATTTSTPSPDTVADMSTSTVNWPVRKYVPRHETWPYQASDFVRMDSTRDDEFYDRPRFVTHIDDAAVASLRAYYDTVLPRKGRILDFCSSWVCHYPSEIETAITSNKSESSLKITGIGMNQEELDANPILNNGRLVVDLNQNPNVLEALRSAGAVATTTTTTTTGPPDNDNLLDTTTCVVSIDYLTQPVTILQTVLQATKPGGTVHLTISNRCFPTKAVGRWLKISEPERLDMVADYLHFAGWKTIEIVTLSDGTADGDAGAGAGEAPGLMGGLQGFLSWMTAGTGARVRDPLWVVRAVKE